MGDIGLSWEEFTSLRQFESTDQHKVQWYAIFSTNYRLEIWKADSNGFIRPEDRKDCKGDLRAAHLIAEALLQVRPEGGRIFIDKGGNCSYVTQGGKREVFATIHVGSPSR